MTGREATGAAETAVEVVVNGETRTVTPGTTVSLLLADMGVAPRGIAVAIDGEVVTRRRWDDRELARGEQLEVLSIAQGG